MNKTLGSQTQNPEAFSSPVVLDNKEWPQSLKSTQHRIRTEDIVDAASAMKQSLSSDLDLEHLKTLNTFADVDALLLALADESVGIEPALEAYVRSTWQFAVTQSVHAALVLATAGTQRIASGGRLAVANEAKSLIAQHNLEDTAYIYDLGQTSRLLCAWNKAMPRVTPFYAVKCNPDPVLVALLASLGAGFDCASGAEIELVTNMNVNPDRIVFANPCKRLADIRTGKNAGVSMTTFDTEFELEKLAMAHPDIGCILRVRCDDPDARVPLGLKYGCDATEAPTLLKAAARLGLKVMGVSFHVGSACKNLAVFEEAIAVARIIFDQAALEGHKMTLLDIGGGFTGRVDANGEVIIADLAATINAAIDLHFPVESGVRIIAEPGRFFAETSATIISPVFGRRDRPVLDEAGEVTAIHKDYWLTDGLYGSFNCIIYDDQRLPAHVLRSPLLPSLDCEDRCEAKAEPAPVACFKSTLWGPTCDSADFIDKELILPEMRVGDFVHFPNAGAYTVAGACDFNGIAMTKPNRFYIYSDCAVDASH